MVWLALAAALLGGAAGALYVLYRLVLGAPFEDGGGFRGSLKRGRRRAYCGSDDQVLTAGGGLRDRGSPG